MVAANDIGLSLVFSLEALFEVFLASSASALAQHARGPPRLIDLTNGVLGVRRLECRGRCGDFGGENAFWTL